MPHSYAVEWKQGDTTTITKEQSINSTVVISGNSVVIDGAVHGDVLCAGKVVTITGIVDGDVLCAAQELVISGSVKGDVRVAAQTLHIRGSIGRNATVLAQSASVDSTGQIAGEVLFGSQSFLTKGTIGPLSGVSKLLDIDGYIRGDTNVYATDISIRKNARIFGSFHYTSDAQAHIADGASVSGTVSHRIDDSQKKTSSQQKLPQKKPMAGWPANAIGAIIFYVLISLLMNAIFPQKIHQVALAIEKRWLLASGVGLLACIALPFLCVFLLVTIIGILLIPVPIFAAFVATGFGRIVASQVFGKSVLKGFGVKKAENIYLQSIIGIPILWCMYKAPFVGGLFSFVSIILGLGAFILSFQKSKK